MTTIDESVKEPLTEVRAQDQKISITAKWKANKQRAFFSDSEESKEMKDLWNKIHDQAKNIDGILRTEVDMTVGEDAVLVHHDFENKESLRNYFKQVAFANKNNMESVAHAERIMIRGSEADADIKGDMTAISDRVDYGEFLFAYSRDLDQLDNEKLIQVTAKWTCKKEEDLPELIHWWKEVGMEAYDLEEGLVYFEVGKVTGEAALIIHETFATNADLQFHLTKGTANIYKKHIDKVAAPEDYFFRGPVSWLIRTYSKFMRLPATYSRRGEMQFENKATIKSNTEKTKAMKNQEITVVYSWKAKEGKADELQKIYSHVEKQMQNNEPGALRVDCYFDATKNTLVVYDLFQNADALGFHLGTTAAGHFPDLLEVAEPGPFLFCGEVPEEMKQAALGMGLNATFAPNIFGFAR